MVLRGGGKKKKGGKKKGGKKKGGKGGSGPLAERVHILPEDVAQAATLQPEELVAMRKRLTSDLEGQLKRRNRCQLERDTMQTFFDITKQQVRTLELEIEAEERIKEKLEENHAIEIKVYVQKAKELECVVVAGAGVCVPFLRSLSPPARAASPRRPLLTPAPVLRPTRHSRALSLRTPPPRTPRRLSAAIGIRA